MSQNLSLEDKIINDLFAIYLNEYQMNPISKDLNIFHPLDELIAKYGFDLIADIIVSNKRILLPYLEKIIKESSLDQCALIKTQKNNGRKIKRVLFYYPAFSNGGIQRVLEQRLRDFIDLGYEVYFITDEELGEDSYELPEGVNLLIKWPNLPIHFFIKEMLKKYQIDWFVFDPYWNIDLWLWSFLFCRELKIYFTVTFHSNFLSFEKSGSSFLPTYYYLTQCLDRLLVISEKDYEFWNLLGVKVTYFPNPVSKFIQLNSRLKNSSNKRIKPAYSKEIILLWAHRFDKMKHPEYLPQILNFVFEISPQLKDKVRIEICSDLEQNLDLKNLLLEQIQEYELENNFILSGYQTDLTPKYQESKIFLSTSRVEGFGLSIIESFAYGLPVVSFDLDNIDQIYDVEPQKRGIMISPQPPLTPLDKPGFESNFLKLYAQNIVDLLTDPKFYQEVSQNALDFYQKYSTESNQEKYIKKIAHDLENLNENLGKNDNSNPKNSKLVKGSELDSFIDEIFRAQLALVEPGTNIEKKIKKEFVKGKINTSFRLLKKQEAIETRLTNALNREIKHNLKLTNSEKTLKKENQDLKTQLNNINNRKIIRLTNKIKRILKPQK